MKLFGFHISREKDFQDTPVAPANNGDMNVNATPGFINPYMSVLDLLSGVKDENDLIDRYREVVQTVQEVGMAVEEITSEMVIVDDENEPIVKLKMDNLELPDQIKELIEEQFQYILNLLKFNNHGFEIVRNWYIDGRIYYHVIINPDQPNAGILELRYIDPKKIKKIREIVRQPTENGMPLGLNSIVDIKEYFVYTENPMNEKSTPTLGYSYSPQNGSDAPVPMTKDSVAFANSGLLDPSRRMVISYLHDALRPATELRQMEQSLLIYRMTRAPERRVFYIDTGDLPRGSAEQYVQEIANKYRTKIVYDSATGAVKNDKRYLSMTEDFWIPRMNGSQGTQIDTLEGGQSVGETGDADYFLDRLYKALHVPKSRFSETPSLFGNGTEVTRDEVRFSRFISRLRNRFSMLFEDLLGKQIVLLGVMTPEEWDEYKGEIKYVFQSDNSFSESMKAQLLQMRLSLLNQIDPFVGKYVSRLWVFENILEMGEDEMKEIDLQNEQDPWLIAQQEAEAAANGAPVKEDEDKNDYDFLVESEVELNGSLADYFTKALADLKKS